MIGIKEKATDPEGKSSRVLQNPSDPEAGYDGHKGPGYQVQLAQSYGENEVNLITACLPQSAAQSDAASLIPVIESQADHGLQPCKLIADTAYGGDQNVEDCQDAGITLISPVPGKPPAPPPPLKPKRKRPPSLTSPQMAENRRNPETGRSALSSGGPNNRPKPGKRNMPKGADRKE